MKLNNGKGWEVMKAHPSAAHHLQNPNAHQNSSTAVNVHGHPHRQQPKAHLPIDHQRLQADLPKPGAERGPPGRGPREIPQNKYGHADQVKRKSRGELAPPAGSTEATFAHSQPNLAANQRSAVQSPNVAQPPRQTQTQEKSGFFKKCQMFFCCGGNSS